MEVKGRTTRKANTDIPVHGIRLQTDAKEVENFVDPVMLGLRLDSYESMPCFPCDKDSNCADCVMLMSNSMSQLDSETKSVRSEV